MKNVCDCTIIHNDIVERVRKESIDEKTLQDMSTFFKVLADNTRVKIIHLLDITEMCVCDIGALLNMSKSRISHQLKKLKEMNLVKSRKVGKEVFYSLKDEHIKQVFEISLIHLEEKYNEERM